MRTSKIAFALLVLFTGLCCSMRSVSAAPWVQITWMQIYHDLSGGVDPGAGGTNFTNYAKPWERIRIWVQVFDDVGSGQTCCPNPGQNSTAYINWSVGGTWIPVDSVQMTYDGDVGNDDNYRFVFPSFPPGATVQYYIHSTDADPTDQWTNSCCDPGVDVTVTIEDGGTDNNIQWNLVGHAPSLSDTWEVTGSLRQPVQVFPGDPVTVYFREGRDDADQVEFFYRFNQGTFVSNATTWDTTWDDDFFGYDIWNTSLSSATPGLFEYYIRFADDNTTNDVYIYRDSYDTAGTWGTTGSVPNPGLGENYFRFVVEGAASSKTLVNPDGFDSALIYVYVADTEGYPREGTQVAFNLSGVGTLSSPTAVTDANGYAAVSITSLVDGNANVTVTGAYFNSAQNSVSINFLGGSRTVDGDTNDWLWDSRPQLGNVAILASDNSETEWVWRDKLLDARDDLGDVSTYDIKEMRIIGGSNYLYLVVEYLDLDNTNGALMTQLNLAIDTEANPTGQAGLTWFGDESNSQGAGSMALGNPLQNAEVIAIIDTDGIYLYDMYTLSWRYASNSLVVIDPVDNVLEAALNWRDLGFSKIPERLRLTTATAKRNGGDPQFVDKTVDIAGFPDFFDIVSFDRFNTTRSWEDELFLNAVFSYVDIGFLPSGSVEDTYLPGAPARIRARARDLDGTVRLHENGETIYTNNPVLEWDWPGLDLDPGDTIVGYYIQISTSPNVDANGFLQSDPAWTVWRTNTGAGATNRVVYFNNFGSETYWLNNNGIKGVTNSDSVTNVIGGASAPAQKTLVLSLGQTYYLRIWARDASGLLGSPSTTFVLPIDYPVWHDPYTFHITNATMRENREPKTGADVNFTVGVYDIPPDDPRDYFYENPATGEQSCNEVLNIILHAQVADPSHFSYGWQAQPIVGDEWKASDGNIAWYLPSITNPATSSKDPDDTYTYFRTDGSIDFAKTWNYAKKRISLGTGGDPTVYYMNAAAGDTVEYFFELNNPLEAPGDGYFMSSAPRRFIYAYDDKGITGYRIGTYAQAVRNPFRFVVQDRDLPAIWHNPLSQEAVEVSDGETFTMRNPVWPTSNGTVEIFVGGIGFSGWGFQMVWRNPGGGWTTENFSAGVVESSPGSNLYYYKHNFNYTGGTVEYYLKLNDNSAYIFRNGITDDPNRVYYSSLGSDGEDTELFRFPFSSQVRVTATGEIGGESQSVSAILRLRNPPFASFDANAISIEDTLDLKQGNVNITGNVLTNARPLAWFGNNDLVYSDDAKIFGRSLPVLYVNGGDVNGTRRAFFGPIIDLDYEVWDTAQWNTGSDVFKNIPTLTYADVFKDIQTGDSPAGVLTGNISGVIHVTGDCDVGNISVAAGERAAIVADGGITVLASTTIDVERLDFFALGGDLVVDGEVKVDTCVMFSNEGVILNAAAEVDLQNLGTIVAKRMTVIAGADLTIVHPAGVTFSGNNESALAKAASWIVGAIKEFRGD